MNREQRRKAARNKAKGETYADTLTKQAIGRETLRLAMCCNWSWNEPNIHGNYNSLSALDSRWYSSGMAYRKCYILTEEKRCIK